MNTTENNRTSDLWQNLLDETFGSSESKPQDTPADTLPEPEIPTEHTDAGQTEPVKVVRKFYKKPLFWTISAAAVLFMVSLAFFLPTLLAFSMWPQLKECKAALDQWQKLDCYTLSSTSYQFSSDFGVLLADSDTSTHGFNNSIKTIARCGKDWLYEYSTSDNNHQIGSVTLCKDGKYYARSYDSSVYDPPAHHLTSCRPQPMPKLFPLTFSWYGKNLQYKGTSYIHGKVNEITVSVTELFGGEQYDLVFYFNSDGTMNQIRQIAADDDSGRPPLTTTHILSTTDKELVQYRIDSYLNLLSIRPTE